MKDLEMAEFPVVKMSEALPQERDGYRHRDRRVVSTPFEQEYERRFPSRFSIRFDGATKTLCGRY